MAKRKRPDLLRSIQLGKPLRFVLWHHAVGKKRWVKVKEYASITGAIKAMEAAQKRGEQGAWKAIPLGQPPNAKEEDDDDDDDDDD